MDHSFIHFRTGPPPSYEHSNAAYGMGPLFPTAIVASGGQAAQPEKVPLDNMTRQNTENERQYLEEKEKRERQELFYVIKRRTEFENKLSRKSGNFSASLF